MKNKIIIAVVSILALVILIGGGIWKWENKQNKIVQQNKVQQSVAQNVQSDFVWYEIPEMDIRFKVDKEIADELIYKFQGEDNFGSVVFSSKELSKIPDCGVEYGPLNSLSKIKGNPNDYIDREYFVARNPKQFDNFFVIYNGPQSVCATENNVKKWEEYFSSHPKFKSWIIGAFDSVEILSAVDVTNWKTYKDEAYGFEVKYPSSWTIKGMTNVEGGGDALFVLVDGKYNITAGINEYVTEKNPKAWFKEKKIEKNIVFDKDYFINSYPAYYAKRDDKNYLQHNYSVSNGKSLLYFVFQEKYRKINENTGKLEEASFSEYLPEFEAMVNSIRFID